MAEEPKESSSFDISDLEATSPETPKAKRAKTGHETVTARRVPKTAEDLPLPGVDERPKKKGGRKVSSEGKLSAAVAGEIGAKSDVEEALDIVRQTAEESAWDAKIAETKAGLQAEDAEWDAKIAEAKAKADAEEAEWNKKIAEAKERAFKADLPKIPAAKDKRVMAPPEGAEAPEYEGMTVESAPKKSKMRIPAIPPESEKSRQEHAKRLAEEAQEEKEEAWFKQGEDPAHVKALAEQQEIEGLRTGIASYDEGKKEVIIDTQEEIDAAVKRAEDMIKSDELNMDMFDIRVYESLLTEQAQLDRDLETAGWWTARGLRSKLRDVKKDLADYEHQMESVERERADARSKARGLPSFPARKVQAREGSGTTLHKEGGGTSVHADRKPGLLARLFGKK